MLHIKTTVFLIHCKSQITSKIKKHNNSCPFTFCFCYIRTATHHCSLCDENIDSFLLYTKHINNDKHRNLLTKYRQLHTRKDADSPTPEHDNESSNPPSVVDSRTSFEAETSKIYFKSQSQNSNGPRNDRYHWQSRGEIQPLMNINHIKSYPSREPRY